MKITKDWAEYYIEMARLVSTRSKDRSTKVGAVIVGERNAIYQAQIHGASVKNGTIVLHFGPTPCADCTRAVIQSGIKAILVPDNHFIGKGEQWDEHFRVSEIMLRQAGVQRFFLREDGVYELLRVNEEDKYILWSN